MNDRTDAESPRAAVSGAAGAAVVHFVEPLARDAPRSMLRLVAAATEGSSLRHHVVVLGPARAVEIARAAGLRPACALAPPPSLRLASDAPMRAALARWPDASAVHAWSHRAAVMLLRAVRPGRRSMTLAGAGADRSVASLLRVLLEHRPRVPIALFEEGLPQILSTRGLARAQVITAGFSPPEPAAPRAELRARWGVDERTMVVLMLADPPEHADAMAAAAVATRLAVTGRRVRLLLPCTAPRGRADAWRWLRAAGLEHLLICDGGSGAPFDLLEAVDVCLCPGPAAHAPPWWVSGPPRAALTAPLPMLIAMAAQRAIVATDGPLVRRAARDEHQALLIDAGDLNGTVERLVRLHDGISLRERLGEAAGTRAAEWHDVRRYRVEMEGLWLKGAMH